jgi:hypothetical protein
MFQGSRGELQSLPPQCHLQRFKVQVLNRLTT